MTHAAPPVALDRLVRLRVWRKGVRYDGAVIRREYRNKRLLRGADIYSHAAGGFGYCMFRGRSDLPMTLWNTAWNIGKEIQYGRCNTLEEAQKVVRNFLANSQDHPPKVG